MLSSDYKDDVRFTVVLVGDGGVGKSSIVRRIVEDEFEEEYNPTIMVDFKTLKKEQKYTFTHVINQLT